MDSALPHKPHTPHTDVPEEFEPHLQPIEPDKGPVPDLVPNEQEPQDEVPPCR